jgi:hypothetical protein
MNRLLAVAFAAGTGVAAALAIASAAGHASAATPAVVTVCSDGFSSPASPFASPAEVVNCSVSTTAGAAYVHAVTLQVGFPTGGTRRLVVPVNRTVGTRGVTVTVTAPSHDGYGPSELQPEGWS